MAQLGSPTPDLRALWRAQEAGLAHILGDYQHWKGKPTLETEWGTQNVGGELDNHCWAKLSFRNTNSSAVLNVAQISPGDSASGSLKKFFF